MDYFKLMEEACEDINIELDQATFDQFVKYKELIQEWNQKMNLTGIDDDEGVFKMHFIDSIKVLKNSNIPENARVMDVGTGAGFPGVPVKIVRPDFDMTLLDSLNKRIKFLGEVKREVGLENLELIHGRAEEYARMEEYRDGFDAVVSRAVANMAVLAEYCLPYVKPGGYFIALKGPAITEEMENAKTAIRVLGGKVESIQPVKVEGADLDHNLVTIKKISNTPKKYPRKAGVVNKNPIK